MDWKIEVVTIPVSDFDSAIDFYTQKLDFALDIDYRVNEEVRLVQLTPPGSSCSIHLGIRTVEMEPGDLDGVFLIVSDVRAAHAQLTERGVDVGEILIFDDGDYRPAREDEGLDMVGCVFFRDPDGNRWCIQQIPERN